MDRYPLIDEFAVIDSGSSDKTLEVASNFGADVYLASDILPEVEINAGKAKTLESYSSTEGRHNLLCGCGYLQYPPSLCLRFGRSAHPER